MQFGLSECKRVTKLITVESGNIARPLTLCIKNMKERSKRMSLSLPFPPIFCIQNFLGGQCYPTAQYSKYLVTTSYSSYPKI